MKNYLIFCAIALTAFTAWSKNSIEIIPTPGAGTLQFEVVEGFSSTFCKRAGGKGYCREYEDFITTSAFDVQFTKRVSIREETVTIYNSRGFVLTTYELDRRDRTNLRAVLEQASRECPATITLDRQSKRILSAQLACDEIN